jgi:hypothetical protein
MTGDVAKIIVATTAVFVGVTINGVGPFTPEQVEEHQQRATFVCPC